MYITNTNSDIIAEYRKKFLFADPSGLNPLNLELFKGKNVIYGVINKNNRKLYIGKTTSLLGRSNQYIRMYRKLKEASDNEVQSHRRFIRALHYEGLDNFVMFPLAIAKTRYEMADLEDYYIKKFNTTDARFGYNSVNADKNYFFRKGMKGHPHTITTKMERTKIVACINPDTKEVIISVGMKLFGDFIGIGKDLVKNCAKRPCKCRGYYIIYLTTKDREDIVTWYIDQHKKCIGSMNSRGIKKFRSDTIYEEYICLVNAVELFIDDKDPTVFSDLGYESIKFLTYNTNPNASTSYVFEDIDTFMKTLEDEDQ